MTELNLWQTFLTLSLTGGIVGFQLLIWATLKRKTIALMGKTAMERFWNHVREHVADRNHNGERTYKGMFQRYGCADDEWPFFAIAHDGIKTIVPVWETGLFARVRTGCLVEIDTEMSPIRETVRRVHLVEKQRRAARHRLEEEQSGHSWNIEPGRGLQRWL
jgi:hypothetical protein